jgi:hypothetical protein
VSKATGLNAICGWKAKLKNRRVLVHKLENGEVGITWVRLENGAPVKTKIRLTAEAALATAELIIRSLSIN